MQRQRGLERVAQHVIEVEMRETLSVRETVGMQHDECAELFGLGEEWAVSRIRQFPPIDVGQNLNTLQFQVRYDIIEFAHGQLRLLQRNPTVRFPRICR